MRISNLKIQTNSLLTSLRKSLQVATLARFSRVLSKTELSLLSTRFAGIQRGRLQRFGKVGNGVEISDNRSVTDYWEIMDVDMRLHKEKICKIESEYGLSFADGNFISAFPYDVSKLQDNVAKFNEALFKLAKSTRIEPHERFDCRKTN